VFDELPAPTQVFYTRASVLRRRHQFGIVLNAVVLVYVFLHKFLMPLVIAAYQHHFEKGALEIWWLYHLVLAFLIRRKDWNDRILRFALGFGMGGVALQMYEGLQAYNWHSVSLWLTSLSSAAVILYFMKMSRRVQLKPLGWAFFLVGGVLGSLAYTALRYDNLQMPVPVVSVPKPQRADVALKSTFDASTCGQQSLSIPIVSGESLTGTLTTLDQLTVKACGFGPNLAYFDPAREFRVLNTNLEFLNVRVGVLSGKTWVPILNYPLRKGETLDLNPKILQANSAILIASDSHPQAGMTVLIRRDITLQSLFLTVENSRAFRWLVIDRGGISLKDTL
jgi:hypothetical protein